MRSAFFFQTVVLMMSLSSLQAASPEDAKLEQFFKNYLEEEMKLHPFSATRNGDHRFDDRLDDLSPKARKLDEQRVQKALKSLQSEVEYAKLSRGGQIDFEILKHSLTYQIWLNENTNPYAQDPRVWNEFITDSVYLLFVQSTDEKVKQVRNAASRMEYIPRIITAAKESLQDCPKVIVETAIRQNRGAIAFYEKGIYELTGETPQVSLLSKPARVLVPLLKEYHEFLEKELLPKAKGEWRIGKEKFARKLELELNAGLTADEVLKDAEAESERVQRDMYVIARQLWSKTFPGKALPPDDALGRRSTTRQVLAELGRDHGQVEKLVDEVKESVKELKQFIKAKDILRLPDPDKCQVIEMPEFQRGNSTAFLNPAPPLDPKAESFYAVSPPPKDWDDRRVASYLQEYNRVMLKILTIHEAYPGHYVQLEYGNRHPSLIRKVLSSGVFAEGWAVYTEQMMIDQGFAEGDLSMRLHQLKWYLRAVINAILDHKMHCTNFSDEEALQLLVEGAFQTEGEALGKIVRSKQSSCQLSTYFAGRMAFYRLRQKISRELGDQFDLGRYHEAVLDHGTLPVKYLPELVPERMKKDR